MATAKAYDPYEDAGLAFSDTDVAEYSPKAWADERVGELMERHALMQRRYDIPRLESPEWWAQGAALLRSKIGWYCIRMELVAPAEEDWELPSPMSKAGKALTVAAQSVTPEDFLGSWRAEVESALRYVVTIGRRASGRWDKAMKKKSNQLANCVHTEILACDKLEVALQSRPNART